MASIAYFSMEVGVVAEMPTYAGGLGILAGDTLRSAADLGVSMIGMTLLHRRGYLHQRLDDRGRQVADPEPWPIEQFLTERPERVSVAIEGRAVALRCWEYRIVGAEGTVPVYFLDADLPANTDGDRTLTHFLYGGDERYRLCQEVVLGVGGVRMLRALGYAHVDRLHMNEGHSSLLAMELLREHACAAGRSTIVPDDVARVRQRCVFTTHTPVATGHDQFSMALARDVLGESPLFALEPLCCHEGLLNLTYLALNFSHYVNGVAMKHGEVSRAMFDGYPIDAITNGVHAATWVSDEFHALFDRHIPGWERDNFSLRYAAGIPRSEIWSAHDSAKRRLLDRVNHETGSRFNAGVLTLGFARRATAYKRMDLLFSDLDRLRRIAAGAGGLQIVYAGKAHPRDEEGKSAIERIFKARDALGPGVLVAYLANHNMSLGRLMTAGVDVWLNTPQPPLEASGTSGMKAALNGVPSLSVLDGWWNEGHVDGVTGWSLDADVGSLYDRLEHVIAPLFRQRRDEFIDVMRQAIALNGSFFNSHRMVEEYVLKAYAA
jgi:glycogen phosphorylase